MLERASTLELTQEGNYVNVRLINETGHKLPTGYPEGRRMWINVQARDGIGTLIWESGAYNPATGQLMPDPQARIYEWGGEDLSVVMVVDETLDV